MKKFEIVDIVNIAKKLLDDINMKTFTFIKLNAYDFIMISKIRIRYYFHRVVKLRDTISKMKLFSQSNQFNHDFEFFDERLISFCSKLEFLVFNVIDNVFQLTHEQFNVNLEHELFESK